MEEKRKYPRLKMGFKIEWRKLVESVQHLPSQKDVTKDTSEGGICFLTQEKLEAGNILELIIGLTPETFIHIKKGQVRWVKESDAAPNTYEIGFEFLEISNSARQELKKVVDLVLSSQSKTK